VTTTSNPQGIGKAARDYRIPASSPWANAWKIFAGVGVLGMLVAAYGYKTDPARFPYSYLYAFYVALSLALGGLFFVLVQYATKASWGVTSRRVAELFMRPMQILVFLVIPLVLTMPRLFPWMGATHEIELSQGDVTSPVSPERGRTSNATVQSAAAPQEPLSVEIQQERGFPEREPTGLREPPIPNPKRTEAAEQAAEQRILTHKRFFLNRFFLVARLLSYLAIWSWLSARYFRWSTEQDETRAVANTAAAQSFSPVAILLFGFSITFFAFDWLLSLNATWYSTIFGVYIFAQIALFHMASLILATLLLRRSGLLGDAVNVEHYHDMGKLLFGWIVFWSYIAFAQFFLTWYSNIPDELVWYHQRWGDNGGTWRPVTLALIGFHFFVPFWFLMSRNVKRRLPLLAAGAACMVVMHVVEAYWLVMPVFGRLQPNFVDLGCLLGVVGTYLSAVLYGIRDVALVPIGDPRLERSLHFENA
jgi:hypothetical protein